ncbi:MAG TPA: type I 3-dehydroquinate dehydratase [Fibrobacteraceae bacterium]|nr:type I 3-dehydroquinate dehydratase [Fibrobacteraceae bacterium]
MAKTWNMAGVVDSGILRELENREPATLEAAKSCSILEIRYDLFKDRQHWPQLAVRLSHLFPRKTLLGSIRLERDGGKFSNSFAKDRPALWGKILKAPVRPRWIDLELDELDLCPGVLRLARTSDVLVLGSRHEFYRIPSLREMRADIAKARIANLDGFKIAAMAKASGACGNLYALARGNRAGFRLFAAFAMGEPGRNSRLYSLACGANLTYASLGHPVTSGMMPAKELAHCMQVLQKKVKELPQADLNLKQQSGFLKFCLKK